MMRNFLLAAVALGAVGWLKLFGPVLYYDMIRQARQSKFAVFRFLYVLLLVFLLFSIATSQESTIVLDDALPAKDRGVGVVGQSDFHRVNENYGKPLGRSWQAPKAK